MCKQQLTVLPFHDSSKNLNPPIRGTHMKKTNKKG